MLNDSLPFLGRGKVVFSVLVIHTDQSSAVRSCHESAVHGVSGLDCSVSRVEKVKRARKRSSCAARVWGSLEAAWRSPRGVFLAHLSLPQRAIFLNG